MTLNTRHLSIIDQTENGRYDFDGSGISSRRIQESHFSKEKGGR